MQSLTFIHIIFFHFQYTTLQMFVEPFAKGMPELTQLFLLSNTQVYIIKYRTSLAE